MRLCTRTVRSAHSLWMDSGLGSHDLQMRPKSVAGAPLHRPPVALKTLCVFICFPTLAFSRGCWLMGFAQASCTPVTTDSTFSPMFRPFIPEAVHGQAYATFTTNPAATPGLLPPIPYLYSVLPQGHTSAISSAATHPTFVGDAEGTSPLSVLHCEGEALRSLGRRRACT